MKTAEPACPSSHRCAETDSELRAELAAARAERDRLRAALKDAAAFVNDCFTECDGCEPSCLDCRATLVVAAARAALGGGATVTDEDDDVREFYCGCEHHRVGTERASWDEDGCCTSCGVDVDPWTIRAIQAESRLAAAEARLAEVERQRDEAIDERDALLARRPEAANVGYAARAATERLKAEISALRARAEEAEESRNAEREVVASLESRVSDLQDSLNEDERRLLVSKEKLEAAESRLAEVEAARDGYRTNWLNEEDMRQKFQARAAEVEAALRCVLSDRRWHISAGMAGTPMTPERSEEVAALARAVAAPGEEPTDDR